MADDRKIFPTETVLALATGKQDIDTREIASFILGRSVTSPLCAKAAAPFAAAWLARWYPKFMDMDYGEGQNWKTFVSQAKAKLGDNISLTAMSGGLAKLANQVLDTLRDSNESLAKQTQATVNLEKRVKELEPLETALKASQKKCADLEDKIKEQKSEMGALRRQAAEFQGKLAINHDDLMQNIKDAIKDGLKNVTVGSAIASTVDSAMSSEAPKTEEIGTDDFGFGPSSSDSDGFGF